MDPDFGEAQNLPLLALDEDWIRTDAAQVGAAAPALFALSLRLGESDRSPVSVRRPKGTPQP
jgi:hypothetical protein